LLLSISNCFCIKRKFAVNLKKLQSKKEVNHESLRLKQY
jgi:hypothetical protein